MLQEALTDRKLDVMNLLWEHGSATPREIQERLGEDTALPAIRALVHNLEEAGHVRAELRSGDFRYYPTLTRREFGREAARRVLHHYFGGSGLAFLRALAQEAGWPEETVCRLWTRLEKAQAESWLTARSV